MGIRAVASYATPLISICTFLGVSAAWLYNTYVFTPWASDNTLMFFFFATGPYVLIGVFGLVNSVVRANLFFSILGLVVSLLFAGCGLLMWSSFFSGHDPGGWGLGFGTIYLWLAAFILVPVGWIGMLFCKLWQWSMARPLQAEAVASTDRPDD